MEDPEIKKAERPTLRLVEDTRQENLGINWNPILERVQKAFPIGLGAYGLITGNRDIYLGAVVTIGSMMIFGHYGARHVARFIVSFFKKKPIVDNSFSKVIQ